jgi:two-component system, response regulator PdtaR
VTSSSTILLTEDEPVIRLGTSAMLEDAGYRVLEAGDASEALVLLSQHPEISLVLTDVQMPGAIDGLALVCIIQADYPKIRSIVTSGRSGSPEARQCGAAKFLPKPYTARTIQAAVTSRTITE